MSISDIWFSIHKEIYFLTRKNFEDAPDVSGIYAWYYPLNITSKSYTEFIEQVLSVYNYGNTNRDIYSTELDFDINWRNYKLKIDANINSIVLNKSLEATWDIIVNSEEYFQKFRRNILKCSILMPPLYVGKTTNLNKRCQQHLRKDLDKNTFNSRFNIYAEKLDLPFKEVSDLIFFGISTSVFEKETENDNVALLMESFIKNITSPPFSKI